MDKIIFLDRDNTLNVDNGYTHKIEDFKLIDGTIKGLKILKKEGYKFVIITNQSGISRGYYRKEDTERFNQKLMETLSKEGIKVNNIFYCPHQSRDDCLCRKPKLGMLKDFLEKNEFSLNKSYVIGDKLSDVKFAINLGVIPIMITTTPLEDKKIITAKNLLEAAEIIQNKSQDNVTPLKNNYDCSHLNPKIISRAELRPLVRKLKNQNKKIVTTNGSYDVLHIGHIRTLKEAKKQGDVLIVGINSDCSIKKYKSPFRPINKEKNRLEFMAALDCVDYVFLFDETDPRPFLKEVKSDVHCNGEEYGEDCIEAPIIKENNGRIHLMKRYFSTTELINKIVDSLEKEKEWKNTKKGGK